MKKRNYLNHIADTVQLHSEPLPGLPLVEIAGDCRVLIERHRGVLKYDRQQICIKTIQGCVIVCGSNLTVMQMTHTQLVIAGKIETVSLKRRNS